VNLCEFKLIDMDCAAACPAVRQCVGGSAAMCGSVSGSVWQCAW
jgi:hypothetical protein